MKFIVPSYTRVGSTWVTRILASLLEQKDYKRITLENHAAGTTLSELNETLFAEDCQVYKTHSAWPKDFTALLAKDKKATVVVCKRNFPDSFVSRVFYERYVREVESLPKSTLVERVLNLYPDIPDAALVNFIIETQPEEVAKEIAEWSNMTQTIVHPRVVVVNYDKFVAHPESLVRFLNKLVLSPGPVVSATIEATSFRAMQKQHTKGFVRRGQVGDARNYFDPQSFVWVEKEIQKLNQLKKITV